MLHTCNSLLVFILIYIIIINWFSFYQIMFNHSLPVFVAAPTTKAPTTQGSTQPTTTLPPAEGTQDYIITLVLIFLYQPTPQKLPRLTYSFIGKVYFACFDDNCQAISTLVFLHFANKVLEVV